MHYKGKRILTIAGIMVALGLLLFSVKYIIDAPYRNQLPASHDLNTLPDPIREQVSAALKMARLNTTAGNLGHLGMVYYSFADYEKAALYYQLAIKKDPAKWRWNYYLGYLNLEQGDSRLASTQFRQVTEKDGSNYRAYYYWGEACQKLGLTDSAEQLFTKITRAYEDGASDNIKNRNVYFPLNTYASYQLARIYMNSGRTDSAGTILKNIINEQIKFGPAYRLLGNFYSIKGDSVLASGYTIQASDLADYTPPPDDLVDEISLLSRSDEYLLKQIDNASRSGNHLWALELCNNGLKYFAGNKYLISNILFANFSLGRDKKALSYADQHFTYFMNDAGELMDATDLLYNKGYGELSLKYLTQVRKLLPKSSGLAVWLYERGKKEEAIRIINGQVEKNPDDPEILADAVRLMVNSHYDDLAKRYFSNLRRISPDGAETWKVTGFMAEKKGDRQKALAAYEEAIKRDPKDLILWKDMIAKYVEAKNWSQSVSHSLQALTLFPNDPMLLEGHGRLLISCPDHQYRNIPEGAWYSERAFIHAGSSYDTRLSAGKSLATLYVSMGDKKKAVKYINMTLDLAKEINKSDQYTSYFKELISKK